MTKTIEQYSGNLAIAGVSPIIGLHFSDHYHKYHLLLTGN